MAKPDYREFNTTDYPIKDIGLLHIAVLRTEWNQDIVQTLEDNCLSKLTSLGLSEDQVSTHLVPGSYELPMGAKMLLGSTLKPDAVICLGCVIQGETKHDDYINHSIAKSINQLSLVSGTPVIFGVLTTNTKDQAVKRADGTHGEKGAECAEAALKMISLKHQLADKKRKISF